LKKLQLFPELNFVGSANSSGGSGITLTASATAGVVAAAIALLMWLLNVKSWPFMYHLQVCVSGFDLFSSSVDMDVGCTTSHRVWPDDLDWNFHMNNSSYNKNADCGRFKLWIKSKAFNLIRKKGWWAANGGVYFQFRKELKLFQSYQVVTRLHSFDDKWMYLQHIFQDVSGKQKHAVGFSKMVVKHKRENIPPETFLKSLGQEHVATRLKQNMQQQQREISFPQALQLIEQTLSTD